MRPAEFIRLKRPRFGCVGRAPHRKMGAAQVHEDRMAPLQPHNSVSDILQSRNCVIKANVTADIMKGQKQTGIQSKLIFFREKNACG